MKMHTYTYCIAVALVFFFLSATTEAAVMPKVNLSTKMEENKIQVRVVESPEGFDYEMADDGGDVDYQVSFFEDNESAWTSYEAMLYDSNVMLVGGPRAQKRSCAEPKDGVASWYGPGFHGREAACSTASLPKGSKHLHIFDQGALTAAHKTIKCGAKVRVTYTSRKGVTKSVIVMITDSGPYSGGRVIDLSSAAANAIGLKAKGVGKVDLSIVSC